MVVMETIMYLRQLLLVVVMETIVYNVYHVSPPCVPYWASYRSEEVEHCLRLLLLVVVMEMIEFTCVPSFTSMCAKFEKWRSNFEEHCLRLIFVGGCHGNDWIHMRTKSPPWVLYWASYRSEEAKFARGYFLLGKRLNSHAYQVSPPWEWYDTRIYKFNLHMIYHWPVVTINSFITV